MTITLNRGARMRRHPRDQALALLAALGLSCGPALAQSELTAAEAAAAAAAAAAQAEAQPAPAPAPAPPRVRSIRLGASAYLPAAAIDAAARPFVGQVLDNRTLAALLDALGGLYDAEGIALATPVIEAVDAARGEVRVGFVEARLGQVRVRSETVSDTYLAYRLNLTPGALADNRVIAERLERLTATDGMLLDADFAPGAASGETDLVVAAEAGPPVTTTVSLDSYGSRGNGRYRLGVNTRISSLTGFNDPLTLGVTLREGARNLSLGYGRVVHPDGTRLSLSLEAGRTRNVQGTDLRGRTFFAGAGLSHPVIATAERTLSANALVQHFREDSTLVGVRTLDQRGWVLSVGVSGSRFGDLWALAGGADLQVGRYTDHVADESRRFSALSVNGEISHALFGGRATGSLSMSGQLALRETMPAPYAFTVTSAFAVRGYPSGALSGDSGLWVRGQIESREAVRPGAGQIALVPFAFIDAGVAYDRDGGAHVLRGRAGSAGLGISFGFGDATSGEVFVARPLRDLPGQVRNRLWVEAGLRHRF
ncbi:MAG: ShlB/FhaC/HecB family hemolysin secretion/activation protein [Rhodobacteraceae bacterium]|nr:ShlB/FhaC/HecB family hemolysin secretion/activation protein [Paracoccaceae bacterium]